MEIQRERASTISPTPPTTSPQEILTLERQYVVDFKAVEVVETGQPKKRCMYETEEKA